MILKDLGEFKLIEKIAGRIRLSDHVVKGIGDDAAVLKNKKDRYLLFTSDMLIEGRHFHKDSGGYLIGKKSISASISDIAAMGGLPKYALVSLGAPACLDLKFIDTLYKGIGYAARRFKIDVVGGDTVNSGKLIISVALLGEVEKKFLVLRSGAAEGDEIFVTGAIGGASRAMHLEFTPRLEEARFLVKNFRINSMIDISDGLLADLGHILESSKMGAVIYEKAIPVSTDATDFNSAIREGEDFEIIFTLPRREGYKLMKRWPFRVRLSRIGEICKRKGLSVVMKDGRKDKVVPVGYTHF